MMDEQNDTQQLATESTNESLVTPENKYEMVMAAAKEAERLNSVYNHRHEKPPQKVTSLAINRIRDSLSKISYEEAEPEETGEQLPFFNPEL
ncbi:MAG: hypothetical protein GF355_14555 [Candidatus Eisenbacteria bacterium]|nr:hypothetical protein [Candidatus Eisenbacteria bacterium]